jgi:SAM-dependent methyltransferase
VSGDDDPLADPRAWVATNRAWWDERAPVHAASAFYDLARFDPRLPASRAFESADLGDLRGRSLVHLQCHLGTDTLRWAALGADVVGLDFSEPAIAAARRLAAGTGLDAEFVLADVHDAVAALGGRTFDVVYTGFGALNWLPDIDRWADVACSLVAPGGVLYVAEFHPFTWVFGDDDLSLAYDYWAPVAEEAAGSYVDRRLPTVHDRTAERNPTIGAVLTAVARHLRVRSVGEHDLTLYPRWPWLVRDDEEDSWRLPPGMPRLPLVWTLLAER